MFNGSRCTAYSRNSESPKLEDVVFVVGRVEIAIVGTLPIKDVSGKVADFEGALSVLSSLFLG